MASLQVFNPTLSPIHCSDFDFRLRPCCSCWKSASDANAKRFLRLKDCRSPINFIGKRLRVRCGAKEGEEPPESLFMKELRKRGITPTMLEDRKKTSSSEIDEQIFFNDKEREISRKNAVSTDIEKDLLNQRERSMALNSEGLEGLIPRAKVLLTVGGTFFLGFVPLIVVTIAFFSALYLFFGSTFVHDASDLPVEPPHYVDPYVLLEDPRMS